MHFTHFCCGMVVKPEPLNFRGWTGQRKLLIICLIDHSLTVASSCNVLMMVREINHQKIPQMVQENTMK